MHTWGASDKFSELHTTPEYDQPLVNQSDLFPAPHQATSSFQQGSQRKCPVPYPKDNVKVEIEVHPEQVYVVPQDRIIHSPPFSLVLLHFPRVPTRIVGQVTFNTQRQRYEFANSLDNTIEIILCNILRESQ